MGGRLCGWKGEVIGKVKLLRRFTGTRKCVELLKKSFHRGLSRAEAKIKLKEKTMRKKFREESAVAEVMVEKKTRQLHLGLNEVEVLKKLMQEPGTVVEFFSVKPSCRVYNALWRLQEVGLVKVTCSGEAQDMQFTTGKGCVYCVTARLMTGEELREEEV